MAIRPRLAKNVDQMGDGSGGGNGIWGLITGTITAQLDLVAYILGITVSAPTTVTSGTTLTYSSAVEKTILADTSGGGFTTVLPTAIGKAGYSFVLKKISSDSNTWIIDANGSQTIDGGLTASILVQYVSITVVSDNTNWIIK